MWPSTDNAGMASVLVHVWIVWKISRCVVVVPTYRRIHGRVGPGGCPLDEPNEHYTPRTPTRHSCGTARTDVNHDKGCELGVSVGLAGAGL